MLETLPLLKNTKSSRNCLFVCLHVLDYTRPFRKTNKKNRLLSLEETRKIISISVISVLTIVAIARQFSFKLFRNLLTYFIPISWDKSQISWKKCNSWTTTCFKHPALFISSIILSFIGLLLLHLALGLNLAFRNQFYYWIILYDSYHVTHIIWVICFG